MRVIINPGTGPVDGATTDNAYANIIEFIDDIGLDGVQYRRDVEASEGDGRFAFVLERERCSCSVLMPGLPLAEVRFVGADGQNIWHFPRLYVDGNSWVWKFAVEIAREGLSDGSEKR